MKSMSYSLGELEKKAKDKRHGYTLSMAYAPRGAKGLRERQEMEVDSITMKTGRMEMKLQRKWSLLECRIK
jgi:hypothetical protein